MNVPTKPVWLSTTLARTTKSGHTYGHMFRIWGGNLALIILVTVIVFIKAPWQTPTGPYGGGACPTVAEETLGQAMTLHQLGPNCQYGMPSAVLQFNVSDGKAWLSTSTMIVRGKGNIGADPIIVGTLGPTLTVRLPAHCMVKVGPAAGDIGPSPDGSAPVIVYPAKAVTADGKPATLKTYGAHTVGGICG